MSSPVQLAARKYRWKYAGMLGFWIQRLTGLGLLFYLFLHVHTIHLLREPEKFQTALDQFGKPLFKLGEIGLLAAVGVSLLINVVMLVVLLTRK